MFGVKGVKFLGFYLIERGNEPNPNKCETFVQMSASTSNKEAHSPF